MRKGILLSIAFGLLLVPAMARADVSARQDSCVTEERDGVTYTKTYFTIVNFGLPGNVCSFRFIPEPQPPLPQCTFVDAGGPAPWTVALNPDGGGTWSGACIAPGTAVAEFWYELDPGFCCYIAQFFDETGQLLAEQEECFCEKPVQAMSSTWGRTKAFYR